MADSVFLTGGSRGIGLALVHAFRAAGYQVAACATTEAGARAGSPDLALACDVSQSAAVASAVARAADAFGGITVVINNAGIVGPPDLDPAASDEVWHRVVDVNLHGTYYVCKHALPHLPDVRGRILNIASILGLRGVPDELAYVAAKHGVVGLTRALAHRVAPRGVTVNAVCPGWVRTDMAQERMDALQADEDALMRHVPLGRFIEPDEVAKMCVYLAGEDAGGVTGQTFTIDAGQMA